MTSKEVPELKREKSPGPDQIRPSELKMVAKEIAWSVSILFNETLVTGELPQEFKMGNIVPLLKPCRENQHWPAIKLQRNYLGRTVLAWFWSYLSQRSQNVMLNGSSSAYFYSSKGVPQGSVLGPLHIYVAGLPSIAEQHNASLPSFADDMSLYCSQKTEEACRDASQALDAISLSLQEIGLTMNTDKTTAMVVNPRSKTLSMASQTAGGSIYCQGRQKWQLYRVLEF